MQIVQRMSATAEGATSLAPLYIYCGHDTTIMPILASLGIQLRDWPPYLSNVVSTPCAYLTTEAPNVATLKDGGGLLWPDMALLRMTWQPGPHMALQTADEAFCWLCRSLSCGSDLEQRGTSPATM